MKKIPLLPYQIQPGSWFYFEKNGITVIHQIYIDGKYLRTDQIKITNKLLSEIYRRKDRP